MKTYNIKFVVNIDEQSNKPAMGIIKKYSEMVDILDESYISIISSEIQEVKEQKNQILIRENEH